MSRSKITSASIEDSTIAAADIASGAVESAMATPLSHRNLIINGDMRIAQRGTSVSGVSTNGYKTCDRFWSYTATNVDFSQSTDAPNGFSHSYRVDGNSSSASATNNYAMIRQLIEAQNLTGLAYGTSSAKSFTFSFWVKASRTGTYTLVFLNHNTTQRQVSATYTVNSAGTWEYKTVTIAGDTSSSFHSTGNATGLTMDFMLNPYTGYTSGTFNDSAWVNNVAANRVHPDQVDVIQGDSDYFAITGVQLEIGSVATPFEHRSYGEELARCRRYYANVNCDRYYLPLTRTSDVLRHGSITFQTEMRTSPSVTVTWDGDGIGGYSLINISKNCFTAYCSGSASAVPRVNVYKADAEL